MSSKRTFLPRITSGWPVTRSELRAARLSPFKSLLQIR